MTYRSRAIVALIPSMSGGRGLRCRVLTRWKGAFDLVGKVRSLLDRPAKVRLLLSIPAYLGITAIELLALGLVFSFVAVLADQRQLDRGILAKLNVILGNLPARQFLMITGITIFALFLIRSILSLVALSWQFGVVNKAQARLSTRVFSLYMSAPYSFILRRHSAELVRNVLDTINAFFQMITGFVFIVSEGCIILAASLLVLIADPFVALLSGAFLTVTALVYFGAVNRWLARLGREQQHLARETQVSLQEGLGGIKPVRVLGRQSYFVGHYGVRRMARALIQRKMDVAGQLPRLYLEMMMVTVIVLASLVLFRTGGSPETLGGLGLFVVAGFRILPSLNRILSAVQSVKIGRSPADILAADLALLARYESSIWNNPRPRQLDFRNRIDVQSVSFAYEGSATRVLDNVNLTIRCGESIGIVGPSGAGKTTIVDILLGLLDPTAGEVLVDGTSIRGEAVQRWQQCVGYVPQDIYLIDDALRRNVALGCKDDEIDEDAVISALHMARLDDFISTLPDGLDTKVGERGVRLSGGQRQRLGIARALYTHPQVVVFDEATSSLDPVTESSIARTLEELHGQLTTVIVAHRLTTVRRCDRLYHLRDGRVVSSGTFENLVESDDDFARLVEFSHLGPRVTDRRPRYGESVASLLE